MSAVDLSGARWRRSSFSDNGAGNCVEIAFVTGSSAIRDSKQPAGGTVSVPPTAWHAFREYTKFGG
ncbi:uncharacterized protein DUF397 [Herbihabitans rhizosphaerae]|uniref:Uncharacterized protein DUF397 n=1 Tax=Herbihabitans rhizosphaerae TaxID=1872711 RepID=A0A4Q7KGR4_9PSEU|nr:DUF397 domain-containing protein [Herbihabitans rhizosphaerae]RZS34061.1 uncharacterized protein DUF397 [Herbihabitans rhizosphaerae]